MESDKSQVQQFYKGTNVFLTGGTGFLGKVLIEKLLRDTEIETIYVLIREKKGKTPYMRIDALFDDVIFDRVKAEKPKCRNRVEAISGDAALAGLGISITDRQKLINNINVIFHAAATVNFDENIKMAYDINVNGPKHLLKLAKEMNKLKSFIHISTAYCNCYLQKEVEEKIYDVPMSCENLEKLLEKLTDKEAEIATPKLLGEWPNTYTFTKALAESLIKEHNNNLPVGIFRPGIVVSTYKEPMEGWVDNLYGPMGMAVGTISGAIRVSLSDNQCAGDLVPVDTCVAGLIASAWDVATNQSQDIPVYNYVSSPENLIRWDEFKHLNFINGIKYVPSNALWYPVNISIANPFLYQILAFILHLIPAAILDCVAYISGKKPKLLSLYKKIHKYSYMVAYFCAREWQFSNNNTQTLWKRLNKADRELFPLSMKNVSWTLYCKSYIRGVRKYLLKEPDSTLAAARARTARLKILHEVLIVISIWMVGNFFVYLLSGLWCLITS